MTTRRYRRARTDYPDGVLAVYDNGGKTADRYTVVYAPECGTFRVTDMSSEPFHPQGVCQHSEWERRVTGTRGYDRVIAFEDLPPACQRVVGLDLQTASPQAKGLHDDTL